MQPTFYRSSDVNNFSYRPRTAEITDEAMSKHFRPATGDKFRIALLNIDNQIDFVDSTGGLPVPGAPEDARRLIEFIYGNLESISSITTSLDTHFDFHIFFPTWWRDAQGKAPSTTQATYVSYDDIKSGKMRPIIDPKWTTEYVKKLGYMMVWPLHCVLGTPGHNLVPALSEAITFHSVARSTQRRVITKGTNARTEHYGIFKAEVEDPQDPGTQLNSYILDAIAQNDRIYVAGQAKSHCVLRSMQQMVEYFEVVQPDVIKKIYFLMDCTSSVQAPGIDFEKIANEELSKMAAKGVVLVNSTDPIR